MLIKTLSHFLRLQKTCENSQQTFLSTIKSVTSFSYKNVSDIYSQTIYLSVNIFSLPASHFEHDLYDRNDRMIMFSHSQKNFTHPLTKHIKRVNNAQRWFGALERIIFFLKMTEERKALSFSHRLLMCFGSN